MTYKLAFNESALKEWKKLGHTIQEQFKKKLRERLENPRVPASQLHGRKDQYKIKLRGAGYRLVYSVEDEMSRCRHIKELSLFVVSFDGKESIF